MFLSHTSLLKQNEYHVLSQYNNKKVLVNSNGYKLVSNICPHQQSLISVEDGSGDRVCPYHNWSFTVTGDPVTSGRTAYYCKNDTPLQTSSVYEWNNLLFSQPVNFSHPVTFDNMKLMETRVDSVRGNYKNIMNLFLDVDHIQTVHRGVYDMIGITRTDVHWEYFDNGSIQTVDQGALWIAVYPYTMIEWQKGSLFITTTVPKTDKTTDVYVHKYVDNNYLSDWKLNEMVWETAWQQDKCQVELLTEVTSVNLEPQKKHYMDYLTHYGID